MPKRILVAPNAFKHSLSAIEVANIVKATLSSMNSSLEIEVAPIADGGDGTIDVLNYYFKKSKFVECNVCDPLMRKIKSKWLFLDKEAAVIELAQASGLALLAENELNPMWANTYGTGELILSALDKSCKKIVVTLGGSATVDAGMGIVEAFGGKILDKKKNIIKSGGGFLSSIDKIDLSSIDKRLKNCKLDLLCDVKIPLTGEKGTVQKFSAQKGATEGERIVLENGMKHLAKIIKEYIHNDFEFEPMVGAAGGVAFSLKALLGAELFSGFTYLSNLVKFEEKIKNSDIVITGEGCLDKQTLMGKAVYELAKLAKKYEKKVIVLCGDYDKDIEWTTYNMDFVIPIKSDELSLSESIKNTRQLIEKAVKNDFKLFINY
ncbi:MAG: glycerate kinase [Candidatus Melainabacteria bacterium]|nr:glycerate kinase [Candidatus Melainabacteria bacterium]